ncbi:unnamed protein product [Durusdinium trenchii]|uniref:Nudix hydrolase domain-containing protein n=1 Tax=Durusdinium trenchii TaxID=1381693 RepID=A0ABP0M9M4_9DINO
MGGLWDVGLSETVELSEALPAAAQRAVQEELGQNAQLHLHECCRISTGWSGSTPHMQVCQADHNVLYRAMMSDEKVDFGERDAEVDTLEYWTIDEYQRRADEDLFHFAPWVHALILGCSDCFRLTPAREAVIAGGFESAWVMDKTGFARQRRHRMH